MNWQPKSCDITPLDCFLWAYIKYKVYMIKPTANEELEADITRVIEHIPLEVLERVTEKIQNGPCQSQLRPTL